MGTKQFNDKKTHRQQAKYSVKTGFVQNGKTEFQDFSRTFFYFSRTQFLPNFV